MAYTKLTVTAFPLTPDALAEFRQARPLPGERPLRESRLKQLLALIKDQKFTGLDWAIGQCKEDGVLYRFDGQHTAHLLQDLLAHPRVDIPFPVGVLVTLTRYEFDSVARDAADIFENFNNPFSVRNSEDKMAGYRAAHPDLKDLDLKFLIKVANGLTFFEKQQYAAEIARQGRQAGKGNLPQQPVKLKARDAGQAFEVAAYRTFAIWTNALQTPMLNGQPLPAVKENLWKTFVNRPALVARMYADWKENVPTATTFWTLVLNETAPDRDDDTRIFADQVRKMNSERKNVTPQSYWRVAATAIKKFKRVQSASPDVREAEPVIEPLEPLEPVTQETSQTPPAAPPA